MPRKNDANPKDAPESDEPAARVRIEKEDFHLLVEDPYFKYLVDKTARTQTWAFLVAIGSVIAAILLYTGLEFKSAKAEIAKAKNEIRDNVAASQQEIEKVKSSSREAELVAGSAQLQIQQLNQLLADARQRGGESETRAMAIIEAARGHISSASQLNRDILNSQRGLLADVSQTTKQANENVKAINALLRELEGKGIPEKLVQVEQVLGEINVAKDDVERIRKNAESKFSQVEAQVNSLKSLQDVNYELVKARSSEGLTLRAHQSYVLQLPNLEKLSADPNSQSHIWVTFKVDGLGKQFNIFWRAQQGEDGAEISKGVQPIKALGKHMSAPMSETAYSITNTPYEFVVEYSNHGIFANDFVVLKVRPKRKSMPAFARAPSAGAAGR